MLADHWLEKGDLRGEYLSLVLHPEPDNSMRERTFQLWVEHHRAWMGGLGPFVPRGAAVFERGFLRDVGLYVAPEIAHHFDADDFGLRTVERLRFLPGGLRPIGHGMRHLRALGPIDDQGVLEG